MVMGCSLEAPAKIFGLADIFVSVVSVTSTGKTSTSDIEAADAPTPGGKEMLTVYDMLPEAPTVDDDTVNEEPVSEREMPAPVIDALLADIFISTAAAPEPLHE